MVMLSVLTPIGIPDKIASLEQPTARQCLAWVIWDEARGEPIKGRRAVLDVVLKRMQTRSLTACEVVMQSRQFSGYRRGMQLKVDEKMLTALDEVCKMSPVVPNSTHFHATYVRPSWAESYKRVIKIGNHIFYREDTHKEK